MKALVYVGKQTQTYQTVPDPTPKSNEHLIKIEAVGICGSDMHAYLGHDERRHPPLILGHEAAGTIVGSERDGERVTINPLVTCEKCSACKSNRENLCPDRQIISMKPREGAFAQYISIPETNLVTVPEHVSFTKAALAEPMAVSWHVVRLAVEAYQPLGETKALVLGGGAIGLAAALALQAMNIADVIILEPNEARRVFLKERCDQSVCSSTDDTFSIVIDAVGLASTRALSSKLTEPGGVIAHVGLGDNANGLDVRRLTLQEISFIGTYTYTKQDFSDTAQAMFDGRLRDLDWFQTRPLEEGDKAFQDLHEGAVANPKIILTPWV